MMIAETLEQEAITKKMYGLEYGSDEHIALLKEYWDFFMLRMKRTPRRTIVHLRARG